MADKDKKHKNMKKRKAEDAPMPSEKAKKDAKKLRTKSQKAINKALGKNY